jgi:hypothetical protein
MLYIISGTSRAGKTLVAKRIATIARLPYLSLDWLIMGFGNGIPDYGIHHMLMPDVIAKKLWSFLKAMFESMIDLEEDCIIEGESILPELIFQLKEIYPDKLKVCFIGYSNTTLHNKVEEIKKYSKENKDWISDKSDEYIIDHVKNMMPHSLRIKKSCKKYNLRYFDTSNNFENVLNEVIKFMLK